MKHSECFNEDRSETKKKLNESDHIKGLYIKTFQSDYKVCDFCGPKPLERLNY